jgi:hypothetical protein
MFHGIIAEVVQMYDKGLAERLTERVGDMFEMEVTYMFGGFGYLMNGNICVAI